VNLGLLSAAESNCIFEKKELLIDRFITLMSDRDFDIAVTQGTGAIKRVRLRFRRIQEIIKEVLA